MLNEPFTLTDATVNAILRSEYGIHVARREFLPIGYDQNAAVYRVVDLQGHEYFLKVRIGTFHQASLEIPCLLLDAGISNLLAPIRTHNRQIMCQFERYSLVVYPFIHGENAMVAGMSDAQWHTFGVTLRAVHDSAVGEQVAALLPRETFGLACGNIIHTVQQAIETQQFTDPHELAFIVVWQALWPQIKECVEQAAAFGQQLQEIPFEHVLCHSDIHAANILLANNGTLYLVDWDSPLLAPRERDLLFIIGSNIARRVTPHEEQLFFETYGTVPVNRLALAYYRYERGLEDIAVTGQAILIDRIVTGTAIDAEISLLRSFFEPGNIIELARVGAL